VKVCNLPIELTSDSIGLLGGVFCELKILLLETLLDFDLSFVLLLDLDCYIEIVACLIESVLLGLQFADFMVGLINVQVLYELGVERLRIAFY
jgi:hypothetical protein